MNQIAQLERQSRLWHIDHAASRILEFVDGMTFEEYETNELVLLAVERQLITVGEALRRALDVDPEIGTQVKLPLLISEVRTLLSSAEAGQNPASQA